MSEAEVKAFLAQFDKAREDFKTWPRWMQEAAVERCATFPRLPINGADRDRDGNPWRWPAWSTSGVPRRVTVAEDNMLRNAAKASSTIVAPGKLIDGDGVPGSHGKTFRAEVPDGSVPHTVQGKE